MFAVTELAIRAKPQYSDFTLCYCNLQYFVFIKPIFMILFSLNKCRNYFKIICIDNTILSLIYFINMNRTNKLCSILNVFFIYFKMLMLDDQIKLQIENIYLICGPLDTEILSTLINSMKTTSRYIVQLFLVV